MKVYNIKFNNQGRGMFSVVNDLVAHFHEADKEGYKINPMWIASPYKTEKSEEDAFLYFFEPLTDINTNDHVVSELESFAFHPKNLITPRCNGNLALPIKRKEVNKIIEKYIKLIPPINQKIDKFKEKYFTENILGLHIRGKGRKDGGSEKLREMGDLIDGVPYNLYFKKVDEYIATHPSCKIFLCSDSQIVIDHCKGVYEERIITYDSTRSLDGEMHLNHKYNDMKYKLGEDVLIEAYLLSMTNYLVHGNSNVTNYVLCKNSKLKNFYIYGNAK
jgi:hypothetical protein